MILSTLATSVMAKLLSEAGTSDFWNETDIISDANWLYRDTAKTIECVRKRDVSTTLTISTDRYVIPITSEVDSVLRLLSVTYDGEPLDFYTSQELDAMNYKWRSLGDGRPYGWYFERGDENTAITLVPPPSAEVVLGFDFAFLPTVLAASGEPLYPFKDGTILFDGLMSMQLSKEGGGRDMDRSDFWFQQFLSHFAGLSKHKGNSWHTLKSPEDCATTVRGGRLPSNYPTYPND
jgi:hypothetical protein